MDSIDYYERQGSQYFEETIDLDMTEHLQNFLERLPENAEVLDLGCGSGRDSRCLEEAGCYVTPQFIYPRGSYQNAERLALRHNQTSGRGEIQINYRM